MEGYLHPGQDVIDLHLDGSVELIRNYANKHGLEINEHPCQSGGTQCRVIAPGWVLDSHNPDYPSLGNGVLWIRPCGLGHDHWLRYLPVSGLLETQGETGWEERAFDQLPALGGQ